MLQRAATDGFVRIAEGAELVFLILKQIRIDRAGAHAVARGKALDLSGALHSLRAIPQNMQGDRRAHPREAMNLAGVAEFFFRRSSGRGLQEFAETSARIGKAPGRQFDAKGFERFENSLFVAGGHCIAHGSVTTETESPSSFSSSAASLVVTGGPKPVDRSTNRISPPLAPAIEMLAARSRLLMMRTRLFPLRVENAS